MPAVSLEQHLSTGHGCFPPTQAVGPYADTAYFNGKKIQLENYTMYATHNCGTTVHPSTSRKVPTGSSTFFMEGKPVVRIGDAIECGDAVAQGSANSFVG